jgi:hypothetical protein
VNSVGVFWGRGHGSGTLALIGEGDDAVGAIFADDDKAQPFASALYETLTDGGGDYKSYWVEVCPVTYDEKLGEWVRVGLRRGE